MNIEVQQIRNYRLRTHHLDQKIPMERIQDAVGACGLQNSPPGAWETALFNRLEGCTMQDLQDKLYREKSLLQAWSYRGVPVVFPTEQSDVFLTPLMAQAGEEPWIYTRGVTLALEYLGLSFDDLLPLVRKAAGHLDSNTVKSKEVLDRTLAGLVSEDLPKEKQALWNAPSMYGSPDKQTVGGAVVSFMLRPCSYSSLVVFGERQGASPTFTSCKNWLGKGPERLPDAEKELVRKFLRCYGPTTVSAFGDWLGSSPQQAKRLWNGVAEEMERVQVEDKTSYMLSAEMEDLLSGEDGGERLILLGAHDPYLDMRDKAVILEDKSRQRVVWRTVANPGVILKNGCIAGIWKVKTLKDRLEVTMTLWDKLDSVERQALETLAEEYAAFRLLSLKKCEIENV